jgi:hypothetical protein
MISEYAILSRQQRARTYLAEENVLHQNVKQERAHFYRLAMEDPFKNEHVSELYRICVTLLGGGTKHTYFSIQANKESCQGIGEKHVKGMGAYL